MSERRRSSKGRRGVGDVVGGFVAGLYSVPEGIGYASLAGISPMLGINAGMVHSRARSPPMTPLLGRRRNIQR